MLDFVEDAAVLGQQDALKSQLRRLHHRDARQLLELVFQLFHKGFGHSTSIELREQPKRALCPRAIVCSYPSSSMFVRNYMEATYQASPSLAQTRPSRCAPSVSISGSVARSLQHGRCRSAEPEVRAQGVCGCRCRGFRCRDHEVGEAMQEVATHPRDSANAYTVPVETTCIPSKSR